ncbi:MAG: divergent polysaccharide deacetylase family protein [Candidatus Omnitrophica bacterium]|nr:divergent polysaccharide deacetylase family protein [Candidatus Omnitrophota bacterium]
MTQRLKIAGLCIIIVCLIIGWLELVRSVGSFIPQSETVKQSSAPGEEIGSPQVALVLDDFGYNTQNVERIFRLHAPVTFSILPNLPYSAEVAGRVAENGHECLLHLPLEPHADTPETYEEMPLEDQTIHSRMGRAQILQITRRAIAGVPGALGVSNHMGSKATEDPYVMGVIFDVLKGRDMLFLDSLVTGSSICGQLAAEKGIRFAKRDVFLDAQQDRAFIEGKIDRLIQIAKEQGYAVGIGHDRTQTIEVLEDMIDEFKQHGIELVHISHLAQ